MAAATNTECTLAKLSKVELPDPREPAYFPRHILCGAMHLARGIRQVAAEPVP
jgi:hypothetical protein